METTIILILAVLFIIGALINSIVNSREKSNFEKSARQNNFGISNTSSANKNKTNIYFDSQFLARDFSDPMKFCSDIRIYESKIYKQNKEFVKQGDSIVKITCSCRPYISTPSTGRKILDPLYRHQTIESPNEGFLHLKTYPNSKNLVATIYKNYNDLILSEFPTEYSLISDEITGLKHIHWKMINGKNQSLFDIPNIRLSLNVLDSYPCIILNCAFHIYAKRKTEIIILFDNGTVFRTIFNSKNNKSENKRDFHIILWKEFLDSLLTQSIKTIRLLYQDGEEICSSTFDAELKENWSLYVSSYKKALKESDATILTKDEFIKKTKEAHKDEICYVYLMKDIINGYHKIGISNNPQYREHTLQSEKPSITLLCSRPFPSRSEALMVESDLHKKYGVKRIRGEWFDLSDEEIAQVKKFLLNRRNCLFGISYRTEL